MDAPIAVRLYPNPATNQVRIVTETEITNITITNMLGQQMLTQNTHGKSTDLDITALSPGVYVVHIATQSGTGTARLIVQ
jgi:hypothetical protein